MSSIAVAGLYKGLFTEDMFDEGQPLPHPYHRTKFEAEQLVRTRRQGAWRVYRPAIVVGDSRTGEMDKIDGPYYMFKALQKLRDVLPAWFPLVSVEWGDTNLVPVDYVAAATDAIAHRPGLDGQVFHLVNPKPQKAGEVLNLFARAGHAPTTVMRVDRQLTSMLPKGVLSYVMKLPTLREVRRSLLADYGIPEEAIDYAGLTAVFDARDTQRALEGSGIELPPLESYAWKLWDYWERHLDPDLYKDRSFEGAVNGRRVVITGASAGIGLAAARKIAAAGGIPILVARSPDKLEAARAEIERAGGTAYAYSCDLSDYDAIDGLVERMLLRAPVDRHARQQRRALDPALGRALLRPLPRLRAHRPAELPRHGQAHARRAAAHAGAALRPHRQRLLDRRADQPAALLGLRRLQGRAGRLDARGVLGDDRRRHHLHDDPHAAGAHRDDRADEDLRLVPDDLARGGRRPHLRGDPRQAQAHQHAAGDLRRGGLRARAQGRRPDPAHGLQGVPRLLGGQGREGRRPSRRRARRSRWRTSCAGCTGSGRGARRGSYSAVRGSTAAPRRRTSKCRCGPVERPVLPTSPIRSPAPTDSPGETVMRDRCA